MSRQTIETTTLSGKVPFEATDDPEIGIYLNDATGTKLDYYLDYDVTVEPLVVRRRRPGAAGDD